MTQEEDQAPKWNGNGGHDKCFLSGTAYAWPLCQLPCKEWHVALTNRVLLSVLYHMTLTFLVDPWVSVVASFFKELMEIDNGHVFSINSKIIKLFFLKHNKNPSACEEMCLFLTNGKLVLWILSVMFFFLFFFLNRSVLWPSSCWGVTSPVLSGFSQRFQLNLKIDSHCVL